MPRFLYSLGILHVGEETAHVLARAIVSQIKKGTVQEVLQALQTFSFEDLQRLPDIGPVVAQSINTWFQEKRHIQLLEKLNKVGVTIERATLTKVLVSKGKLSGRTFVLTGTLKNLEREEAKEKIRALGGDISEAVSKKTSFVIVGENPGSKLDKAKQLGVKTINEKELLTILD